MQLAKPDCRRRPGPGRSRCSVPRSASTPRSAALHFERGKLLRRKNDWEGARLALRKAVELRADSAEYQIELARALQKLDRQEEQRQALEAAIKLDPGSPEAHFALANLARGSGDAATAKSEFEKVRELRQGNINRDLASGAVRAGVLLAQKGDYDGAIREFRKALEINPEMGEAHFDLAGALMQKGEVGPAIASLRAALKVAPKWAEAHYQLGRALLIEGQREQAIAEFRTAIEQDPAHAGAKQALAETKR